MKLNRIIIASLGAAASTLSLAATTSRTAFIDLPAKNFGFIDNSAGDSGGGSGGVNKVDDATGGTSLEKQQQGTNEGSQQQMQQASDSTQLGGGTQAKKADSDLAEGTTLAKGTIVGDEPGAGQVQQA